MARINETKEGNTSRFCSSVIFHLYGRAEHRGFRRLLRRMIIRLEGGATYSRTIRDIYRRYYGVEVGMYTHGPCEGEPDRFMPGTTFGRYSSIYWTARVVPDEISVTRGSAFVTLPNHRREPEPARKLVIGHDVFVGHNVIIFGSAEHIGDGAFIGAGSVIHAPVPPFAVVTGNPARVVRYRFSEEKIRELLEEKWWLKSLGELSLEDFQKPFEGKPVTK